MVRYTDRRWDYCPVDPIALFRRIAHALDIPVSSSECEADSIVRRPFPDVQADNFRDLYLLREALRKYPGFKLGINTREAALRSFYEDEAVNAQTNDRLLSRPPAGAIAQILNLSRKKATEILGRFDEREFWNGWRFGPHSTLFMKRQEASVDKKLTMRRPSVTARAYGLGMELLSREPFWVSEMGGTASSIRCIDLANSLQVCEWDRWDSVTKNALTDRGIGVPPEVNVVLQLSVGRMMRSRLLGFGINLNDQSINQERARLGSIHGTLATVDVKSASQSVTCGLVYSVLGSQPHRELDWRWYAVLDALRCPYTMVGKDLHENELFSAMGNGYTFELESLLFYALSHSCCVYLGIHPDVTVYGDDIILPALAVPLLIEVFEHCGFRINADKSHFNTTGRLFRESCGTHWLDGVDVTPLYVDTPLDTPASIILLANNLTRWASMPGARDGRIFPVLVWVLSHLGEGYLSCGIPYGEGNDGVILSWDEACPSPVYLRGETRLLRTHIGYKVKTVAFEARPRSLADYDRYLRWHYHASGKSGFRPPVVPLLGNRAFPSNPRVLVEPSLNTVPDPATSNGEQVDTQFGTRVVTSWPSLGPWVCVDGTSIDVSVALGAALLRGLHTSWLPPVGARKRTRSRAN